MNTPKKQYTRLATRAIHAGLPKTDAAKPTVDSITMANSFHTDLSARFAAEEAGESQDYFYTRWSNPTVRSLELKIAALENAEDAVAFGSGMAAITAVILHYLKSGDHIIVGEVMYAGVIEFLHTAIKRLGIQVAFVDLADLSSVAKAIRPKTRLILAEVPSNPFLRLCNLPGLADLARSKKIPLAVDSTFATPCSTQPLDHGATLVIHSLSKYIGGHGDALGGIVAGSRETMAAIRRDQLIHLGAALSPFNAWLIARGAATLQLRMEAHRRNATAVAHFLERHPKVRRVIYPGLDSFPQRELAQRQMKLTSGMLTFELKKHSTIEPFVARLQLFQYAVSLGHHKSLIFYFPTRDLLVRTFKLSPSAIKKYRDSAEQGMFRVSVGLEDADDLCEDLDQALR